MSVLTNIYDKSPILIQNLMISVYGALQYIDRYGKAYKEELEFLNKYDSLNLDQKKKIQFEKMIDFLKYAQMNSPYYKEKFKNIEIDKLKRIEDLNMLPILSKEDLRKNMDTIRTISKKGSVEGHTGGTTGKSLVVLYTKEDMMKRMAMLDHFKKRVGFINLKMKRATFNGKHIVPPNQKNNIFWRYNFSCKQMIYSSFHLSEQNIKYYIKSLNKFQPDSLDGFFMSILDIATYINRNNIKLNFQPKAIFPTSETVTEEGRKEIEKAFNCKVFDQYASSEGAPFVTECNSQKLHIELSSGIFEIVNNDREGEILVTSFTTHGTPLIRYKIGDVLSLSEEVTCSCGNHSEMVEAIHGRASDFLYTTSKSKINAANIANLFKNMPNSLIKSQVIQNEIGKIKILLEVDPQKYSKKDDYNLIEEFKHKFGNDMKIEIEHVGEIPREKSGKHRLVKNNLV